MEIQLEKSKVEEKLELIIKCAKTGEEITGQTIYQGKPIGKWLIQYRKLISKGKLKPSNEILKQLTELGLLDKKIDSNLEEKIQELIEWNKQYPFAQVTNLSGNMLRRYTNSDEQYQELLKKYERMQGHYAYIRTRRSQGKLSEKHEEMCKEGNIRGVFGYPSTTIDLSRKYGLNLEKIDYILSKYGNMKNLVTAFVNGKLDDEDKRLLGENFNTFIDISKQGDIRHIKFAQYFARHIKNAPIMEAHNNGIKFFDGTKIPELISRLTKKGAEITNMKFGFIDGNEIQAKDIAEMFNVTVQAINSNMKKSFLKLARYENINPTFFQGGEYYQCKKLTSRDKMKIDSILKKIYSSNLIFIPDEGLTQEPNDITPEELASIAKKLKEFRMEIMQREEHKSEIQRDSERESSTPLENIDFSVKAYNLFRRNGISTVEQLRYKSLEELARLKGMGPKTLAEIQEKLRATIPENEGIFKETKLEQLKHLKAEKEDEAEETRNKTQDASKLLDSYEQLLDESVQINEGEESR